MGRGAAPSGCDGCDGARTTNEWPPTELPSSSSSKFGLSSPSTLRAAERLSAAVAETSAVACGTRVPRRSAVTLGGGRDGGRGADGAPPRVVIGGGVCATVAGVGAAAREGVCARFTGPPRAAIAAARGGSPAGGTAFAYTGVSALRPGTRAGVEKVINGVALSAAAPSIVLFTVALFTVAAPTAAAGSEPSRSTAAGRARPVSNTRPRTERAVEAGGLG